VRAVLVAAVIGAAALWVLGYVVPGGASGDRRKDLALGAGAGALVQIGARLSGVS
jgi:hypothetical protein